MSVSGHTAEYRFSKYEEIDWEMEALAEIRTDSSLLLPNTRMYNWKNQF